MEEKAIKDYKAWLTNNNIKDYKEMMDNFIKKQIKELNKTYFKDNMQDCLQKDLDYSQKKHNK